LIHYNYIGNKNLYFENEIECNSKTISKNRISRLVDKMLELERRRDELEDEQEKDILTTLLERYYRKVYTMKTDYDI
jgi:hypothetical protein